MIDLKKVRISKSPYSESYYLMKGKYDNISWGRKPIGSIRVADHWNFISYGEYHCQIVGRKSEDPIHELLVCEYREDGYHVLEGEDPQEWLDAIHAELKRQKDEFQAELEKKMQADRKRLAKEKKEQQEKKAARMKQSDWEELINAKTFRLYEDGRNGPKQINRRLLNLLDLFEVKYEVKNDAPRGGKIGDYAVVDQRSIRKLHKYLKK